VQELGNLPKPLKKRGGVDGDGDGNGDGSGNGSGDCNANANEEGQV